jgi:rhomboid family protein
MPPITQVLIIANVAIFFVQQMLGDQFTDLFALWPLGTPAGYPGFMPWQLVTYGFLHGGLMHIAFNMFALYMFGGNLERVFGRSRYLTLYFVSMVTAALTQLAVAFFAGGPPVPVVGASGAIFGLLLAYAMYFPRQTLMLIFPPIPMPAWLFVTLYGLLELYLGVSGTQEGVAHFAHLGGMLGALLLIQKWRGRLF